MGATQGQKIAAVREYWNKRPCNVRHSAAPIGTREYFDQVEARKYMAEAHIPGFSEFEKWKGKKVLEIGCGIGTAAASFARAGAHYTGLELSTESLELTKRRFSIFNLQGRFFEGNAEELSRVIPVETYDLIYSFGVIHHSPQPDRIIGEVRKFMGPESEFRLMLYAKNSWKRIMIDAGVDQPEAQSGCPIAHMYTHDEIRKLLVGFNITDIHQDHIFPYIVEKYVRYEYELEPWIKALPEGTFRALEKALGWHTLIRCRLHKLWAGSLNLRAPDPIHEYDH